MGFFNKSRFHITKFSDQVEIKPTVAFTLPVIIIDSITFNEPTTVSAVLVKTDGRNIIQLPTVLTVTGSKYEYTISGTIAALDWDGIIPLNLKVTINSTYTVNVTIKA